MSLIIKTDIEFTKDIYYDEKGFWTWKLIGYDESQDLMIVIKNRKNFCSEEEVQIDLDRFIRDNNLKIFKV